MELNWLWIALLVILAIGLDIWLVPILWRSAPRWKALLAERLAALRARLNQPKPQTVPAKPEPVVDEVPVPPAARKPAPRRKLPASAIALAVKIKPGERVDLTVKVEKDEAGED